MHSGTPRLNQAGPEALGVLIREMASGRAFGASLKVATGMTADELEGAWLSRLDNSMLWLRPLVSDTVILSGAGIAFFVLGTATLKRRRERLAEMAEEEAQEDALYAEMTRWSDVPFMSRGHGEYEACLRDAVTEYGMEKVELRVNYFKMRPYGPKRQHGGPDGERKKVADNAWKEMNASDPEGFAAANRYRVRLTGKNRRCA